MLSYLKLCNPLNKLAPEVIQNKIKYYSNLQMIQLRSKNVIENIISIIINTIASIDLLHEFKLRMHIIYTPVKLFIHKRFTF